MEEFHVSLKKNPKNFAVGVIMGMLCIILYLAILSVALKNSEEMRSKDWFAIIIYGIFFTVVAMAQISTLEVNSETTVVDYLLFKIKIPNKYITKVRIIPKNYKLLAEYSAGYIVILFIKRFLIIYIPYSWLFSDKEEEIKKLEKIEEFFNK